MLEHMNNDDTLVKSIITGEDTWVWQSDVLTEQLEVNEELPMSPYERKLVNFNPKSRSF